MEIVYPFATGVPGAVDKASRTLTRGGIVAYPTETFYGLGVKYDDHAALKRLYALKKRPREKAMPLIIGGEGMLNLLVSSIPVEAERLIQRFWPGPLTLVMKARAGLSEFLTANTGKVAVRMPGQSFALDLARALSFPVTATSANISSEPPAENVGAVIAYFTDALDLVVDCGETPGGAPSTIVDVTGGDIEIVRPGRVPGKEILRAIHA
jgi:L-threonylcarbamoyladenylate synthase